MIYGMTIQTPKALREACNIVGGVTALAVILKVKPPTISQWLNNTRPIPAERCPEIESATDSQVLCEALRPDVNWAVLRKSKATP